jgi:hypothetical protein
VAGLKKLVSDFATAICRVDAKRPVWGTYQPGIGPHTETETVNLVVRELGMLDPATYASAQVGVPYPAMKRQKCDLVVKLDGEAWHVEVKMMRLMGDNGKANDNILAHILSPYPAHRSALTDCQKLVSSGFGGRHAVLIYGYDYPAWPLEPVMGAFECLAAREVTLSSRTSVTFADLVHPVHRSGAVFGWEVKPLPPAAAAVA